MATLAPTTPLAASGTLRIAFEAMAGPLDKDVIQAWLVELNTGGGNTCVIEGAYDAHDALGTLVESYCGCAGFGVCRGTECPQDS